MKEKKLYTLEEAQKIGSQIILESANALRKELLQKQEEKKNKFLLNM